MIRPLLDQPVNDELRVLEDFEDVPGGEAQQQPADVVPECFELCGEAGEGELLGRAPQQEGDDTVLNTALSTASNEGPPEGSLSLGKTPNRGLLVV